jgi:hypothetical protein
MMCVKRHFLENPRLLTPGGGQFQKLFAGRPDRVGFSAWRHREVEHQLNGLVAAEAEAAELRTKFAELRKRERSLAVAVKL